MTSAERRFAATSKEIRVRVESSKNRLTTVRPRKVGSFFIGRSARRASSSAVSRTRTASSCVRSAAETRCRVMAGPRGRAGRRRPRPYRAGVLHRLGQRGRDVLPDEVGLDRGASPDDRGPPGRPAGRCAAARCRPARSAQHVRSGRRRARRTNSAPRSGRRHRLWGRPSGSSARAGRRRRSSRYIVTSRLPTRTSAPSTSAIRSASRAASSTPRVGMPSRTRSWAPRSGSSTSWATRVSARWMSDASSTGLGSLRPSVLAAGVDMRRPASFPASQDGSLKEWSAVLAVVVTLSVACSVRPGTAPSGFSRTDCCSWSQLTGCSHSPYRHGL